MLEVGPEETKPCPESVWRWRASERTPGCTAMSPKVGHSLSAGEPQFRDGTVLGRVSRLSALTAPQTLVQSLPY